MQTLAACSLFLICFIAVASSSRAFAENQISSQRQSDRIPSELFGDRARILLGKHIIRSMEELVGLMQEEAESKKSSDGGGGGFIPSDELASSSEELLVFSRALTFDAAYGIVKPWTLVPLDQHQNMYNEIARMNANNVSGAVVECGVWAGGSSMLMMYSQIRSGSPQRHFWMYDTYEGHVAPDVTKDSEQDYASWKAVTHGEANLGVKAVDNKWIYAPLPLVRNNVRVTGYPLSHVHFVKGKVEETLLHAKPHEPIALLRLDTDFYHSTKAELEHLYPLLVSGGMLIIDDYCAYQGSRLAADEYFASIGTSVEKLLNGRGACPSVPVLTKP